MWAINMMMIMRRLFVATLISACLLDVVDGQNTSTPAFPPTPSPTLDPLFENPDGCYSNTTVLYQAMLRANSFVETTYILCPNTTFEIGDFDADGDCCVNGMYSLFIRSRSIVKCGEDGKSSNNCVMTGGNTHVFYVGSIFDDALSQDVQVTGLTFDDAKFLATAMANRGDITFTDCIWRVSNKQEIKRGHSRLNVEPNRLKHSLSSSLYDLLFTE